MKFPLLYILLSFGTALAADFVQIDGTKVSGTISRTDPEGIFVMTDEGVTKVLFENLPVEVQKQYHYDPAAVAAWKQKQFEAGQRVVADRQAQADLAAKQKADALAAAEAYKVKREKDAAQAQEDADRRTQGLAAAASPTPYAIEDEIKKEMVKFNAEEKAARIANATLVPTLDGFLDMPWGTTPDKGKEAMLSRQGVAFSDKESTAIQQAFTNGTFAGKDVRYTTLEYLDGKLCKGGVILEAAEANFGLWLTLREALQKKYGTGSGSESDRFWEWRFPNEDANKQSITLSLIHGEVMVDYAQTLSQADSDRLKAQKKVLIPTKDL
ncbi:hypothetical protein BH09VER1_BH09VER1_26050 [soil metagenome]